MKFKQLIQKWVLNNWQYKILALIFAFVLWLVIINIQDPEVTRTIYGIPVVKENAEVLENIDYVYSIASGETATVVVTGKKSIVNSLSASDFYASANFEELSITNAIPIKVSLAGSKAGYVNDVSIRVQTTSMILTLDDIDSKTIPVDLKYIGTLADDKNIDSVVVEPAEIEITAPSQTLERIIKVEATVNIDDVENGVQLRATPVIYDYAGNIVSVDEDSDVSANCSEILVSFEVSSIKTVELRAGTSGSPADGYEVANVTYSFDSVILKGSEEILEPISYIRIPDSRVSVSGATKDVVVKIDVTEYLPEGVEIYDNNINVVITASIRQKETESTTTQETSSSETSGAETSASETDVTETAAETTTVNGE